MNISLSTHATPVTIPTTPAAPSNGVSPAKDKAPTLTISDVQTSDIDDVESVPDSALDRNDALGRLISSVFSLPPPPMPAFPASGDPPVVPGLSEVRV